MVNKVLMPYAAYATLTLQHNIDRQNAQAFFPRSDIHSLTRNCVEFVPILCTHITLQTQI